jgi:hypothetical protein
LFVSTIFDCLLVARFLVECILSIRDEVVERVDRSLRLRRQILCALSSRL